MQIQSEWEQPLSKTAATLTIAGAVAGFLIMGLLFLEHRTLPSLPPALLVALILIIWVGIFVDWRRNGSHALSLRPLASAVGTTLFFGGLLLPSKSEPSEIMKNVGAFLMVSAIFPASSRLTRAQRVRHDQLV